MYLLHHVGGIMSEEVLCCINGAQHICDFDLREKKKQKKLVHEMWIGC